MELTQEEITTGNQLIADFMQPFSEMAFSSYYYMPQHSFINCKYGGYFIEDCFRPEEMKYHSSWDWLMPVVDKIESIIFDEDNSFNVTIGSTNFCVIQDSYGEVYESTEDYKETKLLTTYSAIVEFIKWYNQQK